MSGQLDVYTLRSSRISCTGEPPKTIKYAMRIIEHDPKYKQLSNVYWSVSVIDISDCLVDKLLKVYRGSADTLDEAKEKVVKAIDEESKSQSIERGKRRKA